MRAEKLPIEKFEVRLILNEHEACELHDYLMQRSMPSAYWKPKSSGTLKFEDQEKLYPVRDNVFEALKEVLR